MDFFAKNTFFFIANADFTYLAVYYNHVIYVLWHRIVYRIFLDLFEFFIYFVYENHFDWFLRKIRFSSQLNLLRGTWWWLWHKDFLGIFLNQIIRLYHNLFWIDGISSDCEAWLFSDTVLLVAPSLTLAVLTATNLHAAWRFIQATHFPPVQESDRPSTLKLSITGTPDFPWLYNKNNYCCISK